MNGHGTESNSAGSLNVSIIANKCEELSDSSQLSPITIICHHCHRVVCVTRVRRSSCQTLKTKTAVSPPFSRMYTLYVPTHVVTSSSICYAMPVGRRGRAVLGVRQGRVLLQENNQLPARELGTEVRHPVSPVWTFCSGWVALLFQSFVGNNARRRGLLLF